MTNLNQDVTTDSCFSNTPRTAECLGGRDWIPVPALDRRFRFASPSPLRSVDFDEDGDEDGDGKYLAILWDAEPDTSVPPLLQSKPARDG